jgi:chromosome segregation ATPase
MPQNVSLKGLADFIATTQKALGALRTELDEVQTGFNSRYVEWKAEHDAMLERLTNEILAQYDAVGDAVQAQVAARLPAEAQAIAERREELAKTLIPEKETEADGLLARGRALKKKLRVLNPGLDAKEEALKAKRAEMTAELERLNQEIKRLSGCLRLPFSFFRISKLDRERQRVIGRLEGLQDQLRDVRQEWTTRLAETQAQEQELQESWKQAMLELGDLRTELGFLDEEENRRTLAQKRAVRYVVDNLKEPVACPVAGIKERLDEMVRLNIETDNYEDGLASAVSMISLLDGVKEGMARFGESVDGLLEEQRMHKAHLPRLSGIPLSDRVLAFHRQWGGLQTKVRDDARLCDHPLEFVAAVRPALEEQLTEERIKAMFEDMASALKGATKGWRG